MTDFEPIWALGLMSGTSMDGIDAALIETDGERVTAFGPATTTPYGEEVRDAIRATLGQADPDPSVARALTGAHAACIKALLSQHPEYKGKVSIVGLHGHTVLHAPADGLTLQIGDGPHLAAQVGIDVVSDFRSADVAAGGQGAPFAPLYHRALCSSIGGEIDGPVVVLNIGGISNITWIGNTKSDPVAFDTGPGNALMDDWVMRRTDLPFDLDGQVSARGRVDSTTLTKLLDNPYFAAPPPKSLDRLDFSVDAVGHLSPEDGAATLARFTCETIVSNLRHLPAAPARILVTGGGRRNPTLMAGLSALTGVAVEPVEAVGWDGDAIEAQAFGFLAVRSLRGLPLSVPSTTGVPVPTTGGQLHHAA
jgi:anhydro-N-acetylmuramic acid kinase